MIRQLFLILLLLCSNAFGQNTGFESGNLSDWTASGSDVGISTGLKNANYGGGTWTVNPYGTYMGRLYPSGSVSFDSTTAALGLSSTDNAAVKSYLTQQANNGGGGDPTPTNSAWIKRTVTLEAGTTYKYAWNYLSTDYTPYNDGSMITLVHSTIGSITPTINNLQKKYGLLGFTNPGTGEYATGSYGSTGWQQVVFTVPVTGSYVLGFATFNLGDTVLSPMLFIDELQGTTEKNGQAFGPIAPNPGSSAPSSGGGGPPTITGTSTTNNVSSSDSVGNTTTTTNNYDFNNLTYTVTGTNTPTTTTTTTTPTTTTNWSDGSTTNSTGSSTSTSTVTFNYTVTGPTTPPTSPYTMNNKNGVYITQVNAGSNDRVTADQSGHGNYANIILGGSNNTIRDGQGYTFNSIGTPTEALDPSNFNVSGINLSGNTNTVTNSQIGMSNSSVIGMAGNTNTITVNQTGNSNQAYSTLIGNNNTSTIIQSGNSNIAAINLTGDGNNASINQTGNNHGAVLNLINAGGTNTVSVVQTGIGDAYSLQQTCTNPAGCSVSVIRNR
jgi:hypothetical protein